METEKKFFSENNRQYVLVKGEPRWYIEYYIQHPMNVKERKRIYGGINREKDLVKREALAKLLIRKIDRGEHLPFRKNDSPLTQVLDNYKPSYRKKSWQTLKTRLKFYREWLAGRSETHVTTADANNFLNHLLKTGKHPTTVTTYKRALSALYNKLDKDNNPFKDTFTIPKQYTSLMYFRDDQIAAIKKAAEVIDPMLWLAIQVQFYCFIRPGEMRKLMVYDVNLQDGFIEVRAAISKNKKTQKVIIPCHLIPGLRIYIAKRENKNGLLFSKDCEGKKVIGTNHFNSRHSEILKSLKIKGRYAFYSWKHTGVVKAVKGGINIKDLQLQLRHHSLDMVNEYLKNLGIMDSDDLRYKFPSIDQKAVSAARFQPADVLT